MDRKALLVLVDGMRPDSIAACGDGEFKRFFESGAHTFSAKTTFPPVTLPCHMSLFHSVDPERHGVYSNTFVKQNHPIEGLIECLAAAGKRTAFFYTWEELRDLCTPGHLGFSWYMNLDNPRQKSVDWRATQAAETHIREEAPDFVFLHLGETDEYGHRYGWMSPEYLACVKNASACIRHICERLPEEYCVIVTADHGGHNRNHGDDVPEDMLIPILFKNMGIPSSARLENISIKDIAPTLADWMDIRPCADWEGRSILSDSI